MMIKRFLGLLSLSLLGCEVANAALLENVTTSFVLEGERQYENSDGALDPERSLVPAVEHSGRGVLKLGYSHYWNDFSVELRSRPYFEDSDAPETDLEIQQRTEQFSLGYAGRLITVSAGVSSFVEGSGYSWNPSNPFSDIRYNERDNASLYIREGDPYFSAKLDGDEFSFRFMWADFKSIEQDNRLYEGRLNSYAMKSHFLLTASEVTATIATLQQRWFWGSSISSTFGEQLELHAEIALVEQGNGVELEETPISIGNQTLSNYALVREEGSHFESRVLLGGQYTFTDNTNVILEYLYNGSGYSNSEWKALKRAVDYAHANLQDPALGSAHQGFLMNTHNTVGLFRQHYLFARIAFSGSGDSDVLSILTRLNLQDKSFLAGVNKVWNVGDSWTTTATLNGFSGDVYSEYGWVPYELQIQASVEYFF